MADKQVNRNSKYQSAGLHISDARVKNWIRRVNADTLEKANVIQIKIDSKDKSLSSKVSYTEWVPKTDNDGKNVKEGGRIVVEEVKRSSTKKEYLEAEHKQILNSKYRISNDCVLVATAAVDFMVNELSQFLVTQLKTSDAKMAELRHLVNDPSMLEDLLTYSLLSNSYAYCFARETYREEQKLKEEAKQRKKDSKKKGAKESETDSNTEPPAAEASVVVSDDETDVNSISSLSFTHYIRQIYKSLASDPSDSTKKYSIRAKVIDLMNDMVVDFLKSVNKLLVVYMKYTNGKTISADIVKSVIESMLVDKHDSTEMMNYINRSLDQYNDSAKSAAAAKPAAPAPAAAAKPAPKGKPKGKGK